MNQPKDRDADHARKHGWCTHPDHGHGRHRLVAECIDPESIGERVTALYQYRIDLVFWDIVTHYK